MLPYLIAGAIGFGIGKLFENGGETFMAGGRITTNEDLLNSFLTSSKEVKVNNLSTHFNEYENLLLLRNYGTIIAGRYVNNNENDYRYGTLNFCYVTKTKYSQTTTKIVNKLKALATKMGYTITDACTFDDGGEMFMAGGMTNEDIIFEYPKDSNGRVMSWINVGTGNMEIASKTGTVGQVRDGHQLIVLKSETPNKVDYHILVDYLPEENKINMVRGKFNSEPSPKYQSYIDDLFRMLKISQKTRDYQDEDIANQVYVKRYLINNFGNPPKGCEIKAKELGVEIHFDSTNKMSSDWAMKIADKYGYPSGNFEMRYSSGNVPITYVDTSKIAKNTYKSEKGYFNFGEFGRGRQVKVADFNPKSEKEYDIKEFTEIAIKKYSKQYDVETIKKEINRNKDWYDYTNETQLNNDLRGLLENLRILEVIKKKIKYTNKKYKINDTFNVEFYILFNDEQDAYNPNTLNKPSGYYLQFMTNDVSEFDEINDEIFDEINTNNDKKITISYDEDALSIIMPLFETKSETPTNYKKAIQEGKNKISVLTEYFVEFLDEFSDSYYGDEESEDEYAGGGEITDADLNYYIYPTKKVNIAYLGKIQMGNFFSLKDALKEIEYLTKAYPKNEIEKYAIITPDKTFHLGEKEYNIRFDNGGGVDDYIEEQVKQFNTDEYAMKKQYGKENIKDIEYQGFLAIDENNENYERLSDYEFEGEEFDRDNLLEVAKKYPQADYITFHARLMGESDFGIEDELSPIDDLAMEFDMARLNQFANGGEASEKYILRRGTPIRKNIRKKRPKTRNPKMVRTIFEEEYFEDFDNGGGVGDDLFSMSKTIIENGKITEMVIAENVSVNEFNKLFSDKGYEKRNDETLVGFYFMKPNGDTIQLIPSFHKKGEILKYAGGGGVGSKTLTRKYLQNKGRNVFTFGYGMPKDAIDKYGTIGGTEYFELPNGDVYKKSKEDSDKFVLIGNKSKMSNGGEVDILKLYQKDVFSDKDSELIDEAIENGDIDTTDIKEDFMGYVYDRIDKEYKDEFETEDIWEYTDDQYENLLTHKENYQKLVEYLKDKEKYAGGGVAKKRRRSASIQYGRSDTAVDKTRVAKPVGYRFTNAKASELRKDPYAKPTESQIKKYLGKGIYKENRKRHSDKDRNAKL